MRLESRPIRTTLPDPETGDESRVGAAIVLMDEAADVGRTAGWYWVRPAPGEDLNDITLWRAAVREGRGPQTNADAALLAAQTATVESMDLAYRLDEAASLIRAGHLAPDAEQVVEYLDRSTAVDAARRGETDGPGRTAQGLFSADGLQATAERNREAAADAEKPDDTFANCESDEAPPRDEAAEAAEDAELDRSIEERIRADAEVGDTTLSDLLEDAVAEEEERRREGTPTAPEGPTAGKASA